MSVAEENRAALTRAFHDLETGNADAFMALFSDEISWRVMGSSHWSKEAKGLANVQKDLMAPLRKIPRNQASPNLHASAS